VRTGLSRSRWGPLLLALGTASSLACHTMVFNVAGLVGNSIEPGIVERKSYWGFGLFPTVQVDMRQNCPNGTAAITEETRPSDWAFGLVTLGIWTPRTSVYYCRDQPWQPPAPAPAPVTP
jgi:Bor protein